MRYKHFYLSIITRLVIIVLLVIVGSYLFFTQQSYILAIIIAAIIIIASFNIIYYFNKINNWIAFFLLGIENEDTTLKIPSKTGNKAIDGVFTGMQNLNNLFQQTKIEIATKEQYFQTIINQSATGLFSVNEQGRIIDINPAAIKMTELQKYYHINSLRKIDESLPNFMKQVKKNISEQSAIFENRYGQKLLFKLSPINSTNEKIILIAVSDITKELDNSEVDAWIKLARTLSHEIMNNIAPITTLSQVISGYFKQNNKTIKANQVEQKTITNTVKGLEVIEEQSTSLMNFVDNYRKFTKLPEPQMNKINLSSLIEKNLIAATAFHGFNDIEIEKQLPDNLMVYADEKLLSQVIINMLKNASEAIVLDSIKPKIIINVFEKDNSVIIKLINNGLPIPPEIREQIFIPFFTTKEGGSGIGLSLSKQIMLKMDGDIILKPTNDNLTTFIVNLCNSHNSKI